MIIKKENKPWKLVLLLFSVLGVFFCILFLIPAIQEKIILVGQNIRGRAFETTKWIKLINDIALLGLSILSVFIIIFFTTIPQLLISRKKITAVVVFALAAFFLTLTVSLRSSTYSDSDSASELLLAKELAQENKFMSRNWFYSTELRVANTQLVSMPLFKITDNWQLVKILTTLICTFFLCLSYWFLLKQIHIKNTALQFFSAVFLLLPISADFFKHMQGNNYYFPHIIFSYLYIGLFFSISSNSQKNTKVLVLKALYFLIALLSGLAGIRYLIVFQFPLFLATLFAQDFKKEYFSKDFSALMQKISQNRYVQFSFYGLIIGGFGYILNISVLNIFSYSSFVSMYFLDLAAMDLSKTSNIFYLLGYRSGVSIYSLAGITNLLIFFSFGILLGFLFYFFKTLKDFTNQEKTIVFAFLFSFMLNTFIFHMFFPDIVFRYYIPTLYLTLPCIAVIFNKKMTTILKQVSAVVLLFTFILSGILTFSTVYKSDDNAFRRPIATFLTKNNYNFGYATFWNANIVTELTNGNTEVCAITDVNSFEYYRWLVPKRYHQDDYKEDEKVFLLLTSKEYSLIPDNPIVLAGENILQNEDFIIFSYPTKKDFTELLKANKVLF